MRRKILEYVISRGHLYKSELDEWMRLQGMAINKVILGTPAHIVTMLENDTSGKYRR